MTATLTFYGLIVFLSCVLADISSVFDFINAYCVSMIAFLVPAFFYRKAIEKF